MGIASNRRSRFGKIAGMAGTLLLLALLLPAAAHADLSGDEDSYFYPTIGKFTRNDSGPGFSSKEKGEDYGIGVFFRTPLGTRMEASPNVEQATENDRRFIANFKIELHYIKADLTTSADSPAALVPTTLRGDNTTASAIGKTQYRIAHGEGDVGYRAKLNPTTSVEPFLGLGYIYEMRDLDSYQGLTGHTTYEQILHGKAGVRGEIDLGREMSLFGELGLRLPLVTRTKENLAPSIAYKPGMGLSDSETVGFRYAQYRIFLFHEKMAFKDATSGTGILRPESKEETVGLRFGIGY